MAVITVNSVGDADGAGGSALSIRQAIEVSNGTLAVGSLSPSQAALVSGPLASPNTNGPGQGDNAKILIELDGESAGSVLAGLTVDSAATIQGLAIGGFAEAPEYLGASVLFDANSSGVVRGNFLGLDPSGTRPRRRPPGP